MKYACGIDMGARKSQLCTIDEKHSILVERNVPNELATVLELVEPCKEDMEIVVESTSTSTGWSMVCRTQASKSIWLTRWAST